MKTFNNYEEILYDFLTQFVDTDASGYPLLYRGTNPSEEEVAKIGDSVYAVYSVFEGDFGQQVTQPLSLYSYGSRTKLHAKKEALYDALQGAELVIGDGIRVKFTSGSPFVQDKDDPDENIRGYYINMIATIYKA